jgi:hypothetical protein
MNPEISLQWDYEKNGDLRPQNFTPGSGQKVWWKCHEGHSWQAIISNRTQKKNGCSRCQRRPKPGQSLAEQLPKLAEYWHPEKNQKTPRQVTPGSPYKAYWLCDKGHEWIASVRSQRFAEGCARCLKMSSKSSISLADYSSELTAQWHSEKNTDLNPAQLGPASSRKVWWQCEHGHEWQAQVRLRTKQGSRCPICAGRITNDNNSLEAKKPKLAAQWHPDKNEGLNPSQVRPASSRKVWWQCEHGHEWQASVSDRFFYNTECPCCSGRLASTDHNLATLHPDLTSQWDKEKNGDVTPRDITPGSHRKFWWKCNKGHTWQTSVASRAIKGSGCHYCTGHKVQWSNSLACLHPTLAAEWSTEYKIDPSQVAPSSHLKAHWVCAEGHKWQAAVNSRSDGRGCPICVNRGGFDNTQPAVLYLLQREDGVAKIGITGQGLREKRRMAIHHNNGYESYCRWEITRGTQARELELQVLGLWRNKYKAPPAAKQGEDGWTETVHVSQCSLKATKLFVEIMLTAHSDSHLESDNI